MITSDNELLGKYLVKNDATAFDELVRRHSGMVMGVCRNMLFHRQDAEDAFQATFLILAKKAKRLTSHGSISSWLYQVALRNCMQVRRRKGRNRETELVSEPIVGNNEPWQSITHAEESDLIYNEINRLPKRYREVIVLCHLQGHSRGDAAELLGWTDAAVKAALARGRNLLRRRLVRNGLMTSALLVTLRTATTSAAAESVTPSLITTTLEHCQGLIPKSGTTLPGTTPEFVRSLAQQGALSMQTATLTKTLVMGLALLLAVSLPLAVIANQIALDAPGNTITLTAGNAVPAEEAEKAIAVESVDRRKQRESGEQDKELKQQISSAAFPLKNRKAKEASVILKRFIAFDTGKTGSPKLSVNESTNTIHVKGTKQTLEQVNQLLAYIDDSNHSQSKTDNSKTRLKSQNYSAQAQDYNVENSAEYWQLLKKSYEAKLQQHQRTVAKQKSGNATANDRFSATAELYQVRAQIVEANLNIKRIDFEKRNRKTIPLNASSNVKGNATTGSDTTESKNDNIVASSDNVQSITMSVNEIRALKSEAAVEKIMIAEPEIATVESISQNTFAIVAKKPGQTGITYFSASDNERKSITLHVVSSYPEIPNNRSKATRADAARNNTAASTDLSTIPPSPKSFVKPGEALLIEVLADPSLNRRVVVSAAHTISHPYARDVSVKELTVSEIGEALEVKLAKFIRDAEVYVVRESASTPMNSK